MTSLYIDIARIEENSALVAGILKPHGIRLVGVTKACLGDERVAGAMLAGGALALADSRTPNLARLRADFPGTELQLMRSPVRGDAADLDAADLFFVSSAEQARRLLALRVRDRPPASLCLMLETGDGREGVPPDLAADEAVRVASLRHARLVGLATNAACARPGAPPAAAMKRFSDSVAQVRKALTPAGSQLPIQERFGVISVGGSGLLPLFMAGGESSGDLPGGQPGAAPAGAITDLRCGEAILLGRIPAGDGRPLPGAHPDAFVLEATVLEVFPKQGEIQLLAGLGVQDVGHGRVVPVAAGLKPVQITSDYLLLRCSAEETAARRIRPGHRLSFLPDYYALLAAMTSPFVKKVFRAAN